LAITSVAKVFSIVYDGSFTPASGRGTSPLWPPLDARRSVHPAAGADALAGDPARVSGPKAVTTFVTMALTSAAFDKSA